jgi:hypothetical protein
VGSVVTCAVIEAWAESPRIMRAQGTVAWMRGWPLVDIQSEIRVTDSTKTATAQQKTAGHYFMPEWGGGLAEKWFGCGDAPE